MPFVKILILLILAFFLPSLSDACSVCFGGTNKELARGFTWGIIILGSLPYLLLASFFGYFYYHTKKNKRKQANS